MPVKKTLILLIFVAFPIPKVFSQQFNQSGIFLISINPLKLLSGILNAEFEYQFTSSASIQLSSEYVLFHYVLKKEKHPDFVIRIGLDTILSIIKLPATGMTYILVPFQDIPGPKSMIK